MVELTMASASGAVHRTAPEFDLPRLPPLRHFDALDFADEEEVAAKAGDGQKRDEDQRGFMPVFRARVPS